MYRDHIVVDKWWRNISPNIAAAPFRDQLGAQQEGVYNCDLFCFIPMTSCLRTYVRTINKLRYKKYISTTWDYFYVRSTKCISSLDCEILMDQRKYIFSMYIDHYQEALREIGVYWIDCSSRGRLKGDQTTINTRFQT